MALPLERWAAQAVLLEAKGDCTPVADSRVLQDIDELKELHQQTWRRRQRELVRSGEPLAMPESTYGGVIAYPPAQVVTTTTINGTVNLWSNLVYTPIPINAVLAPQVYRIMVAGKITTVASPGNLGFNPLINSVGTWTTGGTAVSGGSTLGATGNVALKASISNAFYYILGDLTIRNGGTASVITAMFHAVSTQDATNGVAGPAAVQATFNLLFGGTDVRVDTQTTGQSLQIGAVHSVTSVTHNIQQIHWMDWN